MAVNCSVVLMAIEGLAGVTVINRSSADETVKVVDPETEPEVAEIVVIPVVSLLAKPKLPALFPTVATAEFDELHWTVGVRSWIELSVYVPVAANCWVVPSGIDGMAGVTAMDTNCAGVIVSGVDAAMEPEVADMFAFPAAIPLARPVEEIIATAGASELHVTDAVRFCVLPSEYVPVAVNCCVVPSAIDAAAGVMVIDCKTAGSTDSDALFDAIDPSEAEMLVLPTPVAVASPVAPSVATVGAEEVHVTTVDRFCVAPFV